MSDARAPFDEVRHRAHARATEHHLRRPAPTVDQSDTHEPIDRQVRLGLRRRRDVSAGLDEPRLSIARGGIPTAFWIPRRWARREPLSLVVADLAVGIGTQANPY